MEALGALVAIGVVAAAPRSRVLRPVAKAVLKGGMAVAGATVAIAAVVTEEVGDLVAKARSEHASEAIVEGGTASAGSAAEPEDPLLGSVQTAQPGETPIPEAGKSAAAAVTSNLRPLAKSAAKSGLALADVAKGAAAGAAAVASQQISGLAASVNREKKVDQAVSAEEASPSEAAESAPGAVEPAAVELTSAAREGAPASSGDDLTRISGIGPKAASLLQAAGITSFAQLAATPVEQLRAILDQAGPRYRVTDPSLWPERAQAIVDAPAEKVNPFDNSDLLQIDGIGPKVGALLQEAGITTISQLATSSFEQLRAILDQAGPRYRVTDPTTWPAQAQTLLAEAGQS